MTEKEQLTTLNNTMRNCVQAVERIETLLIGDKYNEEGLIHKVQKINDKIETIEQYQLQQRGGINLGKWIIGTSLGAFLITQFQEIQNIVKNIFK